MDDKLRELLGRALYEHWCEEVELGGHDMAVWDALGDKQTWLDRASAILPIARKHYAEVFARILDSRAAMYREKADATATGGKYDMDLFELRIGHAEASEYGADAIRNAGEHLPPQPE